MNKIVIDNSELIEVKNKIMFYAWISFYETYSDYKELFSEYRKYVEKFHGKEKCIAHKNYEKIPWIILNDEKYLKLKNDHPNLDDSYNYDFNEFEHFEKNIYPDYLQEINVLIGAETEYKPHYENQEYQEFNVWVGLLINNISKPDNDKFAINNKDIYENYESINNLSKINKNCPVNIVYLENKIYELIFRGRGMDSIISQYYDNEIVHIKNVYLPLDNLKIEEYNNDTIIDKSIIFDRHRNYIKYIYKVSRENYNTFRHKKFLIPYNDYFYYDPDIKKSRIGSFVNNGNVILNYVSLYKTEADFDCGPKNVWGENNMMYYCLRNIGKKITLSNMNPHAHIFNSNYPTPVDLCHLLDDIKDTLLSIRTVLKKYINDERLLDGFHKLYSPNFDILSIDDFYKYIVTSSDDVDKEDIRNVIKQCNKLKTEILTSQPPCYYIFPKKGDQFNRQIHYRVFGDSVNIKNYITPILMSQNEIIYKAFII